MFLFKRRKKKGAANMNPAAGQKGDDSKGEGKLFHKSTKKGASWSDERRRKKKKGGNLVHSLTGQVEKKENGNFEKPSQQKARKTAVSKSRKKKGGKKGKRVGWRLLCLVTLGESCCQGRGGDCPFFFLHRGKKRGLSHEFRVAAAEKKESSEREAVLLIIDETEEKKGGKPECAGSSDVGGKPG